MTNIGDVIRQIETLRNDSYYPPTEKQQETMDRILFKLYTGTVHYHGSR